MTPRVSYSCRPDAFRDVCSSPTVYIAPRERIGVLSGVVPCNITAVEDLDKTDTWLALNEAVQRGTPMVYDRVSRFYKMTSDKARKLARLADVSGNVAIVDIVPFCEDITRLYMTWRYIDRAILGHAHYYAFAGGHAETFRGQIVASLDPALLAHKLSPHCRAEPTLRAVHRDEFQVTFTAEEHAHYLTRREALFASKRTPQPILTRLADTSHAFCTRRAAVRDLCRRFLHPAVVCNTADDAMEYSAVASAGTYAKPPEEIESCDGIIFAEPPIIHTYRRFDIESAVSPVATIIDVVGDTKVDSFLCGRIKDELTAVLDFMKRLERT